MPLVFTNQDASGRQYWLRQNELRLKQDALNREFYNAAANGSLELMSELLRKGADVNGKIHPGQTALYVAAKKSHADCVTFLLERNADVNEICSFGSALHDAGTSPIVKALIVAGADVNCNSHPRRPLASAAKRGHTDSVAALLEAGAVVDARDDEWKTALHEAVEAGHVDCVRTLIQAKADINAQQNNEWTPLHVAANYGQVGCLKVLLEAKADLYIRDRAECTALEWAAHKGYIDCVTELLKYSYCLMPYADPVLESRERIIKVLGAFVGLRNQHSELDNLKDATLQYEILSWDKSLQEDLVIVLLDELKKGREIKGVALIRSKEAAVGYLIKKLRNYLFRISRSTHTTAVKALLDPTHLEENVGAIVREGLTARIEELKT